MSLPQGSQPVQPSRIPYDLYCEIVRVLGEAANARRENPSRSWIDPHRAKGILVNLARVSKNMKELVYPHIYPHIELTSSQSLNGLLWTLTQNPEIAHRINSLDVSHGLSWTHQHSWPHPPVIHQINDREELAQLPLPGMQSDVRVLWRGVCKKVPTLARRWSYHPDVRNGMLHLVLLLLMLPNLRVFRSLPWDRRGKAEYLLSTIIMNMTKTHAKRFLGSLESLEIVDLKCRNNVGFLRKMVLLPRLQTLDLPISGGMRVFALDITHAREHSLPLQNVRIQSSAFSRSSLFNLLRSIQRLEVLHYPITDYIRPPVNGGDGIKRALDRHRQHLKELNLVIDHHCPNRQESLFLRWPLPLYGLTPSWSFAAYSTLRALHIPDVCLGFGNSESLRRTNLRTCLPACIETLALMTRVADIDRTDYIRQLLHKCLAFQRLERITLIQVQRDLHSVSPNPTICHPAPKWRVAFEYVSYA
ncbi:hypothetical protein ASPVEDRAFT_71046 [Aspergillus versicolor CBS 583.65]|uniref:F-box domain-containing protein n=1 Tax=Aspergillus versicolor CBS 583.65 TaxID=1036611 RepID=A0A1L9PHG0_ASPVE|nr:uncharacterized protein ASPVEDRAFT_71046 [Aspergillus versicolor CBS 583.65]OJJ00883.1 hypothetical protein ASPVEDRAFT_71046 [Aspergillus versicolor CBS 583.65]